MIIHTYGKAEVGKIYHNQKMTDKDLNVHICSFMILRETIREEYINNCGNEAKKLASHKDNSYYYEISLD